MLSELQKRVDRARVHSEEAGLYLNVKKTKVMKIENNQAKNNDYIDINGEPVENEIHLPRSNLYQRLQ